MLFFKNLNKKPFSVFVLTWLISAYTMGVFSQEGASDNYTKNIQESLSFIQQDPETAYTNLSKALPLSLSAKDTASAITCLIGLGDIERFRGNYEASFDFHWNALILANLSKDIDKLPQIHRNIGILYDIYNKDELALEYLKSSLDQTENITRKQRKKGQKTSSYFSLANFHRRNENYNVALAYLDSCKAIHNYENYLPYVESEQGYIYMKQGKYSEAKKHLYKPLKTFEQRNDRYLVVILSYLGDLNYELGEKDSALYYYSKSVAEMHRRKAFQEIKPELLLKLSTLQKEIGQLDAAYQSLKEAKAASDTLFNATNRRNNKLFEIRNEYKEQILEQESLIKKQTTVIEEKNRIQGWMKILFISLIIISLLIYISLKQHNKIRKLAITQDLERTKNDEILELKTKELASYALQMIEKDKSMNELLETIKKDSSVNYSALKNKHTKAQDKLWNDFNRRFTEINDGFYERLLTKHPDLSFTEQKHCALIKLNFDSSEMANILNISLQSVHTSRYRIRKKLGLAKGESLSTYITKL